MWPSVLQVNYSCKKTNALVKVCLCNVLCTMENNSISVLLKKSKLPEDGFRVKGKSTHQMHCGSNSSEVATNIKWIQVSTSHLILNRTGNEKKQLILFCCCSECMASSVCWTLPWAVGVQLFIPACTCQWKPSVHKIRTFCPPATTLHNANTSQRLSLWRTFGKTPTSAKVEEKTSNTDHKCVYSNISSMTRTMI